MSLTKLLSDFQKRDRDAGNIIQKLERRVKILEEQNDPTAIIEPEDFDFISGGRVINGCEITSIDDLGGGFGTGFAKKDIDSGAIATCLVKFAKPVRRIDGVHISFESGPEFDAVLVEDAEYSGSSLTLKVSFITEDFDPKTVNKINKPSSTSEITKSWTAAVTGGNLKLTPSSSGTIEMSMGIDGVEVVFDSLKDGPYFGLEINMDGDQGGLSGGIVQCEVNISTLPEDDVDNPLGLDGDSTYVTTIF